MRFGRILRFKVMQSSFFLLGLSFSALLHSQQKKNTSAATPTSVNSKSKPSSSKNPKKDKVGVKFPKCSQSKVASLKKSASSDKSSKSFEKLCACGDSPSCVKAAIFSAIKKDKKRAKYFYNVGCDLGDITSCYLYSESFERKNIKQLTNECTGGKKAKSCLSVAQYFYELGYFKRAAANMRQACLFKDKTACNYVTFLATLPETRETHSVVKRPIDKQSKTTKSSLVTKSSSSSSVTTPTNPKKKQYEEKKALSDFQKQCREGSGEGCFNAGKILTSRKNHEEARRMYGRACSKKVEGACELFKKPLSDF
ncbi:MAG: hypothetical protein R3A80_09780 [Bdellovibrionota bacterium]